MTTIFRDDLKNAIDEETETDGKDESELVAWLKENDLSDIESALRKKKYTLLTFKYLNDDDLDAVIDDLKTDDKISMSTAQILRFKSAVMQLSSASHNVRPKHYKATKSDYTYSVDLKEFYSTTQTLTIIGGSRVGKSSMKDVVMGKVFDENRFPTIRMREAPDEYIKKIQIQRKRAQTAPKGSRDITVKYHIWDCPGQKALEHIPPLYITGAMAVLIVYDITDKVTWKRGKEWMEYIRDAAKGYDKVLVIGNKKDLESQREVSYEEANNECMMFGYNFLETSAKTGVNMSTLQRWLDSHSVNKVEKKITEYKDGKNGDWKNERIRLEVNESEQTAAKEDEFSCCNF